MPIRIGGLASGMDIDSIVNDLMRVERTRVDKVAQNRTVLEWTRDKYNEVNKMFADFVLNTRQSFGLTDASSGSIVNKSVNSLKWVKSATSSDTAIADISARSNAVNGSYNVKVKQLASNWSSASQKAITVDGGNRSNIRSQFDLSNDDIIDFTISTNIGTEKEQKVQVFVDSNKAYVNITTGVGTRQVENKIDLEGKNISNLSLKNITDQINKADIGVTAVYDESIDRFFLQTNETGSGNSIQLIDASEIHDESGNLADETFIGKLKLQYLKYDEDNNASAADVESGVEYKGQDAILDFGMAKDIVQSSNQFTINNIDFNLKAIGETTIRVEADQEGVIEKVREFVNQYNELVDKLDKILGETRYRDYAPLAEEQRADMSEKEIELWEEKARSGLLRNDQVISSTMRNIRFGLYESVEGTMGAFNHLNQIGIETESYSNGSMGGKLKIDEAKLRAALRSDVDGVIDLLFKEPDSSITDDSEKRSNTGLVGRMYGDLVVGMKEIIVKAGLGENAQLYRNVNSTMLIDFVTEHSSISMLDKSINDYSKRVSELERRLLDRENAYWQRFTAMETALSRMYSQSNWLTQQLGMW